MFWLSKNQKIDLDFKNKNSQHKLCVDYLVN